MKGSTESPCERLAIKYHPLSDLKPHRRNPRTHSKHQIGQLAASIREFGFTNPILADAENRVIAGHGRLLAAEQLGLTEVPICRLEHLSEAQLRAYIIADNKLAENAGWDEELLSLELKYITELDLDFDLEITGFETAEIDILFDAMTEPADSDDDIPLLNPNQPTVSRSGDLWLLGRHRLLCADATKKESFSKLMGDDKAQIVFIDPPYNLPIEGHVSGLGVVTHSDFAMAAGEMPPKQFRKFLQTIFGHLDTYSIDGSIHYVFMDWRHVELLLRAARKVYSEFKNLCVWNKTNGGMGSLYRSKHELVFVFKRGTALHINNIVLGKHGRQSIHYVFMDWRHVELLLRAARKVYSEFKNLCVWNKTNGGMGSLYRSKHELVFVFKRGTALHINNIVLGKHGRYRTNVWDYPGVNTFGAERLNDLHDHPTVKPVALVADALLDCSKRGGLVLDCFGGSGTTLLAAERTGRRACVMELEPKYVDISIERFQRIAGIAARHAKTGMTYETLARRTRSTDERCSQHAGDVR